MSTLALLMSRYGLLVRVPRWGLHVWVMGSKSSVGRGWGFDLTCTHSCKFSRLLLKPGKVLRVSKQKCKIWVTKTLQPYANYILIIMAPGHFGKLIATTLCQYSGKILCQMAADSIGKKFNRELSSVRPVKK